MVMMGSAFAKNNRREIRRTIGRYMAILAIIALGVGFFAGIRVTRTAMVKTGDEYLDRTNMFDFRLISTLGITDEDVEYFRGLDGVTGAEGSVSRDFLALDESGREYVLKALMLGNINMPSLVSGRMPDSPGECLADRRAFSSEDIGTKIKLSDRNDEKTENAFSCSEYTIVGLCNSPLYLNNERGTTNLKGGSISGFVYIPRDGFEYDVYTEAYLTIAKSGEIFSDEYSQEIEEARGGIEKALDERANLRYTTIVEDARAELDDAKKEYDDGYSEYQSEKADALGELENAKAELDDARIKLDDSKSKLVSGEAELESGEKEYASGLSEYEKQAEDFQKKKEETEANFEESQRQITEGKTMALDGIAQIEATGAVDSYNQLGALKISLEQLLETLPPESQEYAEASAQLEAVTQQIKAIDDSGVIVQYNGLIKTIENLDGAQMELDAGKKLAQEQFENGQKELDSAKARLDSAREELDSGKRELSAGWTAYENGLQEYNDGVEEYEKAKKEAEEAFADAEAELSDADKKISDAEKEIADIEKPDTYVLDRETNTGYVCFDSDSSIVAGVAKVFPIFFFLVAALVCVTTMTRMVDDQRTQIGTLKALGYSNGRIIWKYVYYSGSAAALGCVLGFLLGSWIFPKTIWMAYGLLYGFDELTLVLDWKLGVISLIVALACSAGTTFAACRRDLAEMPAELMRPRAPAVGKRILLERIPFIWKRMSFLHKVTARNIFRYKKRLFMMVLGISGCTALVVTGLGLRDSITNIASDQFGNIMKYDYTISFSDNQSESQREKFVEDTDELLSNCVFICSDTIDVDCGNTAKSANIIATSDPGITDIINLHLGDMDVAYPKAGSVALSRKIAESAGVSPGDTVTLRLNDVDTVSLPVSGVFENYFMSYVLMTEETYADILGRETIYDTAYATYSGNDIHGDAAELVNEYGAAAVSATVDLRDRIDTMLGSMDYIVMLVIACAGALAFIVLFNLSNINITERQREIATIKVLGFYPKEAGAYVFRENFLLAAMGAVVGIGLGTLLHRYVMSQIDIDMVSFNVRITLVSYLLGIAITFAFTTIVDLIMRRKLNRINMAESLKATE